MTKNQSKCFACFHKNIEVLSRRPLINRNTQVFARMSPYDLGRAACVCRKWKYTIRNPVFWRSACLKAWQVNSVFY